MTEDTTTMGWPRYTCMDLEVRARALGVETVGQLNDCEKVELALSLLDDVYRTTDPPPKVSADLEGACERVVRARTAYLRQEGGIGWDELDVDGGR